MGLRANIELRNVDLELLKQQLKDLLDSNCPEVSKTGIHNLLGEIRDQLEEAIAEKKRVERYFLKYNWQEEYQEVTKEEFIQAERNAGFKPKLSSDHPDYMKVCATGGFSSCSFIGKVRYLPEE